VPRLKIFVFSSDFSKAIHIAKTVLYVKVRFLLVPVTEHIKIIKKVPQLLVEIKGMPVGIVLPKDGHEPEDPALEPETLTIDFE
jgi:hypothetical protein